MSRHTNPKARRRIGGGNNVPSSLFNLDPAAFSAYLQQEVTGGDLYGTLGEVTPSQPASPDQATQFAPTGNAIPVQVSPHDFYSFHLGDLFFPGAPAWVLDQKTETPLVCLWGNGLLLAPNRGFQAYPAIPPIYHPTLPRVATPWGAAAAYPWGVPVLQEKSIETPIYGDQSNFDPTPNIDFQSVGSDY